LSVTPIAITPSTGQGPSLVITISAFGIIFPPVVVNFPSNTIGWPPLKVGLFIW